MVGTAAMTAWQTLSARLMPADDDTGGQESSGSSDPWEEAPAPAKVAKRIAEGVFGKDIPSDKIDVVTQVMHWSYGTGWGAVFGVVAPSLPPTHRSTGPLFGAAVWAMSYVQLVPMGIYKLPWKYPARDLAMDLSYHVVYGTGVVAALRAIPHRSR